MKNFTHKEDEVFGHREGKKLPIPSLNNLGIRKIGATTASIIGANSPAMTALIAWATISETLNVI
ncbi:DMT family transporter [Tolypothrix sp. FACHB-123]|uniref:DMT family transporter n=1 Tax=Tolypothrix sp. FACHB-123 TaxID=2692868 RepID=UPI001F54972F|nr:DMT family transporter [Tolypothrix sp. FACHB-123]